MSGRVLGVAAGLFACLAILACEQPTDPLQPAPRQLLIHCVLDVVGEDQTVKVEWTGGDPHQLQPVHNATVTITAPSGQTFSAAERTSGIEDNSPALYSFKGAGLGPFLLPGEYTLRVRMPTGEEASGTATVPTYSAAPVQDVFTPFVIDRDTLRLSWPRVPSARSYEVRIYRILPSDPSPFSDPYTAFADTSISIAGMDRTILNKPVFSAGFRAWIQVSAVDDNYYTYYHPIVDPFAGAPPSRLKGALGVFGVVVPIVRRVYWNVE